MEEQHINDLQFSGNVSVSIARDPETGEVVISAVEFPVACLINRHKPHQVHVWGAKPLPPGQKDPNAASDHENYTYQMEWRLPATCLFTHVLHRAELATLTLEDDSLLCHQRLFTHLSCLGHKPNTLIFPPSVAIYESLFILVDGSGIVVGRESRADTLYATVEGEGCIVNFAAQGSADLRLLQDGHICVTATEWTHIDTYARDGKMASIVVLTEEAPDLESTPQRLEEMTNVVKILFTATLPQNDRLACVRVLRAWRKLVYEKVWRLVCNQYISRMFKNEESVGLLIGSNDTNLLKLLTDIDVTCMLAVNLQ